ncbi:MAG: translation initiation factor IF-1, partial [Actinobacteria bacterium]|nr:translation initiation factor IF-1 [Actinomycetota bacterium]
MQSPQEKNIQEGTILESLPSLTFKVKLSDDKEVLARLSGKMRIHHI